jgi:L-aminopeptidase/D-esterase-like protein
MSQRPDYYKLLHVQPDAPDEVIKASYRTLMQRLGIREAAADVVAQAARHAQTDVRFGKQGAGTEATAYREQCLQGKATICRRLPHAVNLRLIRGE